MTQGIFKSLEKLEDMIESIIPKTDPHHSFVAIQTGNGRTLPLNRRANNNRYFEIETTTYAEDDGEAGLSGRKRTSLEVRVEYFIPQDLGFLKRLMNEDAAKLIDTLKGPDYDLVNTGIVSVIPGIPSAEPLIGEIDGELLGYVLTVPFDLLFLES
jgi:hypothetical protein